MKKQIISMALAAIISASAIAALTTSASAEWVDYNGKISYISDDTGETYVGWKTIGRNKYYFGRDGVMRTGWQSIGGKTYYFGRNGVMRTGWRKIGGNKYYFGTDGRMRTGWVRINGKRYYFNSKGVLTNSGSESATSSAQAVLTALKKELGSSYTCDKKCGSRELENIGFDMRYVESYAYECNSVSAINADVAIIVEVDSSYRNTAAELLQSYYEQIYNTMQMYNSDVYRVEQARIFSDGKYAALLILGDYGDWDQLEAEQASFAFGEALKVDRAWKKIFGSLPVNLAEIPEEGCQLND